MNLISCELAKLWIFLFLNPYFFGPIEDIFKSVIHKFSALFKEVMMTNWLDMFHNLEVIIIIVFLFIYLLIYCYLKPYSFQSVRPIMVINGLVLDLLALDFMYRFERDVCWTIKVIVSLKSDICIYIDTYRYR